MLHLKLKTKINIFLTLQIINHLKNLAMKKKSQLIIFFLLTTFFAYSQNTLVEAEYFFDIDPGVGNGINIPVTPGDSIIKSFSIPVSSLNVGHHYLAIRVKNNTGLWSIYKEQWVYVFQNTPLLIPYVPKDLTKSEYFFDTDPGVGNGIDIPVTSGDSITKTFSLPTLGVNAGYHTLGIRSRNTDGLWSIIGEQLIYVKDTSDLYIDKTPSQLIAAEYFIDNDPGVGNGFPIAITIGDSIEWTGGLDMDTLSPGEHQISFRTKNVTGLWSIASTDTFRIAACTQPTAHFTTSNVCIGDTLFLINQTTNTDTLIRYDWDINNDGIYDLTSQGDTFYIYSSANNYDITLKATNSYEYLHNCPDSITINVEIYPNPITNVTVYGSEIICPGESVSIGASSGLGYSYQWLASNTAIPNANNGYYNATANGAYSVQVTSFYGCIDTSLITNINMYSMPSASITVSGNNSFCYGDSATLNASTGAGLSYLWYKNGSPLMSDTLSNLTVNTPGNYKVQLSSTDGCLDESSPEIITVNPLPIANLFTLSSSVFCNGDSVILQTNVDTGYNYIWYKNGASLLGDTLYQLNAFTTGNYSVKITNANNCSALSASASIIANPIPTSTFSLATATCSQDTVNIVYTGNASSSAFLNWNFDGGIILNGTGLGPYQVKWDSAGYRDVSLLVSDNSCISSIETNTLEVKSIVSSISAASTSVCQGDSVLLYANAGTNYTYQWYQGGLQLPTANGSAFTAIQTGNYQVKVTDSVVGCSLLSLPTGVTINPTNFGIAFSANNTSLTQPPFNVNFTNQTPNMSNYQFDWDLGDGNTSLFYNPSHNYLYNGTYTVNLYAEDASTGCRDTLTKVDYISCSGGIPNPCNIVAAITPGAPISICKGDSVLLHASAGIGYTYQWVYNNVLMPNKDSIILYAKKAGNYRVVISDSLCSQTSPAFILNHYPSIQPVIQVTGSIQPCTTDSMNLNLFVSYNTYNWNTGSQLSNIYVSQTGYYQVAVTDNYGCNMTSAPYVVSNSFLNPPELCIVGVDSANHNRLVWERHSSVLIDSFYVYKESYIAGQYDKIGSIPYTQTSLFVDINSNPAVKSYRYKIAAVDTCGGLTLLGNYHKTIHLTINAGLNGSWNLIWDGYEGFIFNSYRIYRGTNVNNMSLLTQLASTANSYTDLNPPSGAVYYQIEVVKTSGCYPDTLVSKAKTNYNHSRSNTANNININPVYLDANFAADIQTGIWPIQVGFTDLSTGSPDTWVWDFGDGNTSIEQNPAHTYNNSGVYTVSLVACNGAICDTTERTDYIEVLPNGIVEIGVALSTKLYPNPNDGNFTLEINDKGSHELQVHIYNVYGAEVFSESFNSNGKTLKQLQLNKLSSGVYFVHLNTSNKVVYQGKVIIEK